MIFQGGPDPLSPPLPSESAHGWLNQELSGLGLHYFIQADLSKCLGKYGTFQQWMKSYWRAIKSKQKCFSSVI